MNENFGSNRNAGSPATTAAIGFVLGAAVGAGIALLLAPAAGEDTRRRIGETGRRLGGTARRQMDRAVDTAKGLGEEARSVLKRGAEKLGEIRGSGDSHIEPADPGATP